LYENYLLSFMFIVFKSQNVPQFYLFSMTFLEILTWTLRSYDFREETALYFESYAKHTV
jgi:hypothetical protein